MANLSFAQATQSAGVFLVDNSQLQGSHTELGFRRSKNIDDRFGYGASAKFGSLVIGISEGDWVNVGKDRYLPKFLQGKQVLVGGNELEHFLAHQAKSLRDATRQLAQEKADKEEAQQELAWVEAELDAAKKSYSASVFLVDNTMLKSQASSVGYRKTRDLDNRADGELAKFGSLVVGIAEDGWVQVEDGRYLPMFLEGKPILVLRKQIKGSKQWQQARDEARKAAEAMEVCVPLQLV